MESKEVKSWQDKEALDRYRMIAPLLEPDIDDAKRCKLREEIVRGKMNLPSCGKEFFPHTVSRFFFAQ